MKELTSHCSCRSERTGNRQAESDYPPDDGSLRGDRSRES